MADPRRRPAPRGSVDRLSLRYSLAVGIASLVAVDTTLGRLPLVAAGAYVAMTLVSFALYDLDKRRAQQREWRISEATLHAADLFAGITGGLVAQERFRHKTSKHEFAVITYAIAGLHIVLLLGVAGGVITLDNVANFIVDLEQDFRRNQ